MTRFPLPAMNQHGTIERQCTGKHRYATRKQARSVARSWGKLVYRCKLCDGWHLKTPEGERG
ncbi:MAG TPA: hypothetical protein VFT99_03925 [Roseiflexaceae bacterium]|nr:hypothetical protein [Roseiflexaceae bacterium]